MFDIYLFDVDKTLVTIEGIDWLAGLRGDELLGEVRSLTNRAMDGSSGISIDDVFAKRLNLIKPNLSEIESLGKAYINNITDGAEEVIAELLRRRKKVYIVTGGIELAVLPLAEHFGLGKENLFAVLLEFDCSGAYLGYDQRAYTAYSDGKIQVVRHLQAEYPNQSIVMIGDGITDVETKKCGIYAVAFTGNVKRPYIVAQAHKEIINLRDILGIDLPPRTSASTPSYS